MKVNEYIYRNWANWNFAILKELCEDEGIEWSEELVGYLKKTPTNTNWSLLKDFGIEPYGVDEDEEEDEGDYELHHLEGNDYSIYKSMNERTSIATVSHPNEILGKKYDIYRWQDAETGESFYALSGDEFSTYQYSFKINSFENGRAMVDGSRNYIKYKCEVSSDHGEGWSEDGEVWVSEPYDEESRVEGEGMIHNSGIIRFQMGEPQE